MKNPRPRRVLFLIVLAGLAGLGMAIFALRGAILESWWLVRLSSEEYAERVRAAKELGKVGSGRAAAALLESLRARTETGLGDTAVMALESVFGRVDSSTRLEIIEGLLHIVSLREADIHWGELWRPDPEGSLPPIVPPPSAEHEVLDKLETTLERIASLEPGAFPILRRSLTDFEENYGRPVIAAHALADAWPASRSVLESFLGEAEPRDIAGFYALAHSANDVPIARHFARTHDRAAARAISLVHGALVGQRTASGARERRLDGEFLARRFRADTHPVVRETAVRIAGACGHLDGNLDLPSLIVTETEPRILRAVVEARSLWAWGGSPSFEVLDGIVRGAARPGDARLPWKEDELARLREILATRKDPDLRDAASIALARARDRFLVDGPLDDGPLERLPDLVLHEWGVWKESGGAVLGPATAPADLPSMVHRSTVPAVELKSERESAPAFVFKPVVFFQSPRPETVTLRVGFHRGRPWVFYPEVTDYVDTYDAVGFDETPGERSLVEGEQGNESTKRPPWIDAETADAERLFDGSSDLPGGELRRRFALVPWSLPLHERTQTHFGSGYLVLSGIGLEWCGLRVGYPEELEGPVSRVPDDGWWSRLREVPTSSVALRGERERFLFYDGVVDLPPPVAVRWADRSHRALRIDVRSFDDYLPSTLELDYYLAPLPTEFLPAVAVVEVREGRARGRLLRHLAGSAGPILVSLDALPHEGNEVRAALLSVLTEEGLTREEADALLDVWETEFHGTEGLRLLTVLPDWIYGRALPLEVRPVPGDIVRVGIVWRECDDLAVAEAAEDAAGADGGEVSVSPKPSRCEASPLDIAAEDLGVTSEPLGSASEGSFDIAADGRLSGLPVGRVSPLLSADGRRLALPFVEGELRGIRLLDLEQRRVIRAFQAPRDVKIRDYSLSGTGRRISVVLEEETGKKRSVHIADVGRQTLLTVPVSGGRPTWTHLSDDGSRLAVLAGGRPFVADLASGRRLIPGLPTGRNYRAPMLSADGRVLALLERGEDDGVPGPEPWDLLLLDLEEGSRTTVAEDIDTPSVPSLSADGSRVVYRDGDIENASQASVFLVDLQACRRVRIGTTYPGKNDPTLPGLTLDGKTSVWIWRDVWTTDAQSGKNRLVLRIPDDGPEWESVAISGDASRLAYLVKAGSGEGNWGALYVRRLAGKDSGTERQPRPTVRKAYTAWWWR